jgi:UPF0042 nucleotide-binding protein
MYPITVLSFGYLHPWPEGIEKPSDENTYDLREKLFDPAHVPGGEMRDRTGLDDDVRIFVFETEGAPELFYKILDEARGKALDEPVTIAFGCAGGRHRSVAMAQEMHKWLKTYGHDVSVEHLHVHLPRVIRKG